MSDQRKEGTSHHSESPLRGFFVKAMWGLCYKSGRTGCLALAGKNSSWVFSCQDLLLARIIHEIESSECKVLKGLCVNGLTSRFWSKMVISVCNRPPGVLAD